MRNFRLFLFAVAGLGIMATTSCKKTGCTDPNAINYNPDAKKDDGTCITVADLRKVTFFEYTATWCGPCGSWGTDAFNQTISSNPNTLVPMSLHASSSDPMWNAVADAFYDVFTIQGWPNFWIGNDYKGTNTNVTSEVNTYLGETNVANAVVLVTKNGDGTWDVKVQVEFFAAGSGEYYVAVYITEDGIDGSPTAGSYAQNGNTDPGYTHDHVLRASANGSPWGESIGSSPAAGTTVSRSYTVTLDSDWVESNLHLNAIIWKKSGSSYQYVNATDDVHEQTPEEE